MRISLFTYFVCVSFFCIILLGPPKQPVIFFHGGIILIQRIVTAAHSFHFFFLSVSINAFIFNNSREKTNYCNQTTLIRSVSLCQWGSKYSYTWYKHFCFVVIKIAFCLLWIFPIWFFAVAFTSSSSFFVINFNSLWIVLNICVLFVVFFSSQMISVHDYDKDYIDDRKHTTNQSLFFTVYFSSFSSIKGPILFVLLLFQFRRLWQNKKKRIIIIKKKTNNISIHINIYSTAN